MTNTEISGVCHQEVAISADRRGSAVLKEGEWVLVLEVDKGRRVGICDNVQFRSTLPDGWAIDLRIEDQDGHGHEIENAIRIFKDRDLWLDGTVYRVLARLHRTGRIKIMGHADKGSPDGQWRPMNVTLSDSHTGRRRRW